MGGAGHVGTVRAMSEAAPGVGPLDATADGPHLPSVHVADRRGLTATGAVALALLLGVSGAVVDVLTGRGLETVFAICFIAGCAIAAATVHREDLVAAVVMPPLVYLVVAGVAAVIEKSAVGGSWVTQQSLELMSELVLSAPVLLVATAAAAVVAVVRRLRRR